MSRKVSDTPKMVRKRSVSSCEQDHFVSIRRAKRKPVLARAARKPRAEFCTSTATADRRIASQNELRVGAGDITLGVLPRSE